MWRYAVQLFDCASDLVRQVVVWMFVLRSRAAGQGLVEYGLILVLIAITVVGILTLVGQTISTVWYEKLVDGWPG